VLHCSQTDQSGSSDNSASINLSIKFSEIQVGVPASFHDFETVRLRTSFFWEIVLRYWAFVTQRILIFKDQ
jgi:hypothetical protein